jgi:hypothetical protein
MSAATVKLVRGDGSATGTSTSTGRATIARVSAIELEARDRARAILEAAHRRAEAIVADARLALAARDATLASAERAVMIEAIRVVAERVIGEALATDDDALARWSRAALDDALRSGAPRWIALRASAEVIARLPESLTSLPRVRCIVDDSLASTELAITTDLGDAVTSTRLQVDALLTRLAAIWDPREARDV